MTVSSCRMFLVIMRHKKFRNGYMMKRLKDRPSLFFNTKAPEAVAVMKISFPPSPARSVISQSSKASRISMASSRPEQARIAVKKAVPIEKQMEQKHVRLMNLRVKLLELEMRQKQFEFQHQLELAKLEAERQVEEARER